MAIVVDFAWHKPTVAELQSWGAVAVGMYVSHDASKSANADVVNAYAHAGIKTFLFFEDTGERAKAGYSAGHDDATFAYQFANRLAKPRWAPVIPAVDFDVPDFAPSSTDAKAKLGPVGEYLRAWHDVNHDLGVIVDTVYGGYYVVHRATQAGLSKIGIQTIAWSGGQIDLADIACLQGSQTIAGGQVDVETIESTTLLSHIAWIPGEGDPMQPTQPTVPDPPPGAWHDKAAWDWVQVKIVGTGHDGKLHSFDLETDGHWHKAE